MHIRYIGALLIVLGSMFTPTLAQGNLKNGYKALNIYNYFEAKRLFAKQLKPLTKVLLKDVNNPKFNSVPLAIASTGLATIYVRTDNPFSNLDSAYKYAKIGQSLWLHSTSEQKAKYNKLFIIADTNLVTNTLLGVYKRGYTEALAQNNTKAIEEYLAKFPDSPQAQDAGNRKEFLDWTTALATQNYQSIQDFLIQYPATGYKAQGLSKIDSLQYVEARRINTKISYSAYISYNPQGKYKTNAEDELYTLAALAGSENSFANFVNEFPTNRNINKAYDRLLQYYEDGSVSKLNAFKAKYPNYPNPALVNEYLRLLNDDLLPVYNGKQWGYIDSDGKQVIDFAYDSVGYFVDGIAMVKPSGSKISFITAAGRPTGNKWFTKGYDYQNGLLVVEDNAKWGAVNYLSDVIIPFEFDSISLFNADYAAVVKNRQLCIYNIKTKQYSQPFASIDYVGANLCTIADSGKYRLYNLLSGLMSPPYEWIGFEESGLLRAKQNGLFGVINTLGQVVIPFAYNKLSEPSGGMYIGVKEKTTPRNTTLIFNFISANGSITHEETYTNATPFFVSTNLNDTLSIVTYKGLQGMVNKRGRVVVPLNYEAILPFADSLAPFSKGGKWGYINTSFKTVIKPTYLSAEPFNKGLAIVETEEGYSLIDIKGTTRKLPTAQAAEWFNDDFLLLTIDEKYKLFNPFTEVLLPYVCDDITFVTDTIVKLTKGTQFAYYHLNNNKLLWQSKAF